VVGAPQRRSVALRTEWVCSAAAGGARAPSGCAEMAAWADTENSSTLCGNQVLLGQNSPAATARGYERLPSLYTQRILMGATLAGSSAPSTGVTNYWAGVRKGSANAENRAQGSDEVRTARAGAAAARWGDGGRRC
jgi:hypothetical protein